ncbi:S-phase kinase-associated protein 2 [Lonchura striata]|uniref:S-phase kinase-associated protein 2 n=1 Tax=Lonchura striata TaxID=40157 RepID=A0A218UVH6_9PASE|nr:S-phase kinase-associated protein 2 [Lonchura striata domestica]
MYRASGFCCVCRKHLQEIPSSSTNVSTTLEWDPGKTSELLSGMGVSALKKDKLGNENTPQDLLVSSPCLPPKRQKVKDNEKDFKDFVIVRQPWLLRQAESGISLDALPDELLLAIFACLPLKDLLKVSTICKRWHRLSLLKIQHLDLSNCTVSAADLHSILCLCEKLQNLSLEGLVLSDNIININCNEKYQTLTVFQPFLLTILFVCRLEELNLSWCEFTAIHVKAAVNHITSKITQLNLSGYRENLQIADVKTLVERCPLLVHLDLSDSMMLKPECFQYFKQLVFLQHLCLSRCYQISSAALVELGEIRTLKTLQVFGIVTDSSLQLLEEALPDMKINGSHFTSIARPTVGNKKSHEIWGIKCRLTLRNPSFL